MEGTKTYALQTFDDCVEAVYRFDAREDFDRVAGWIVGQSVCKVDRAVFERFARALGGFWEYTDGRAEWVEIEK